MKTYYITYGFISSKARYYSTIEAESRSAAWFKAQTITNWGCAQAYESKEEAMIRPGQELVPLVPMGIPEYYKKEEEKKMHAKIQRQKKIDKARQYKLF